MIALSAAAAAAALGAAGGGCACNMTGQWRYVGGKGEELYLVAEAADGGWTATRISSSGSWTSATGAVNASCGTSVRFPSGMKDAGQLSGSCDVVHWGDGTRWARGASNELCRLLPGPDPATRQMDGFAALGNGYTCAVFDVAFPRLVELRGDFRGQGRYGANVIAGPGAALESEDQHGAVRSSTTAGPANVTVLSGARGGAAVLRIDGVADGARAAESWTLTLSPQSRSLRVETAGQLVGPASELRAVRHSWPFAPTSIYALFDRGVVQMKGKDADHWYASADGLSRIYALGGPGGDLDTAGNMSVALRRKPTAGQGASQLVVIGSSNRSPYSTFQAVLAAAPPPNRDSWLDNWSKGWSAVAAAAIGSVQWTTDLEIAPNDADFPAQGATGDVAISNTVAYNDLRAMLTGIYGSPVGQLCTHDNAVKEGERVGQMATTIARPSYGYSGNYNFFDPDNYISTASLVYSGDPYLQEQVRAVLERNGDFINAKGQLPHHFQGTTPTYQALSGETQTGPNVFWILSCFNYAKASGNLQWLKGYMPKLRNASAFLYDMIDPAVGLLSAPGSLMIDVFIRNNFTTDTNAMVVGFFREFADAEEAVGNATGAAALRGLASSISASVDRLLWGNSSGDHYVTQLNPDGSTRDFVDYDANLIALAHGVAPPQRAQATLARIDRGRCAHGRATFVSEKYYGKEDTTGGNIGDSWCSMGRIGWFDALARRRYGDQKGFDELILDPLVGDVNRWTWLHERYACDGSPQQNRTAMYFEYPAVTAMMVHYIRYGIQLGLLNVTISPFGPAQFSYKVGSVQVEYNPPASVALSVPGSGIKWLRITGLQPGGTYAWTAGPSSAGLGCSSPGSGSVQASADGKVEFQVPVGDATGPCFVRVTQK
eukprot:TRINITY_DN47418_c0_g1_i1.p1 TRINITY_DN47418_c0_g1~~TRINITY_DN47418_c0_g1_i1.p1  ORF type:complete len:912 (+),score=201.92 TRINITY_DN47418_c0_g1_i1:73-2736(+)